MRSYPACSPHVTAVGATELAKPQFRLPNPPPACSEYGRCFSGGSEQAVSYRTSGFVSGGGFADYESRAHYNAKAVRAYLNSNVSLPNSSWYNARGRGFPDVTAFGYNGLIVQHRGVYTISGTSMSTPIFAGIVALLQGEFSSIANRTLGFLNPLLYKAGSHLYTDITLGNNCQSKDCMGQQDGYYAATGWDPVSGLGSPRYPEMRQHVRRLAHRVKRRREARMQQQSA